MKIERKKERRGKQEETEGWGPRKKRIKKEQIKRKKETNKQTNKHMKRKGEKKKKESSNGKIKEDGERKKQAFVLPKINDNPPPKKKQIKYVKKKTNPKIQQYNNRKKSFWELLTPEKTVFYCLFYEKERFCLDFYGISIIVRFLMPNPVYSDTHIYTYYMYNW